MTFRKREKHVADLRHYTRVNNEIVSYLLAHSNLPGKRGNIELAFAFAEYIEDLYSTNPGQVFAFCVALIDENPPHMHVIGNEEFLPFCGIVALGRIGAIDTTQEPHVIAFLKSAAQDERWRIREAVAMAIQELMDVRPETMLATHQAWVHEDNDLLHRAVAAGVAEPRFMKNEAIARVSLALHKAILERIVNEPVRRDPEYQALVKGLCYTLSVVITGIEDDGFAYLEALIATNHPIMKKIVRENVKKKRLTRLNAEKVIELQQKLEGAV